MPYTSQQTFESVRGFYSEIDSVGEFQKGDTEVYGEYKEAFFKLLQNEMPFFNRETGRMCTGRILAFYPPYMLLWFPNITGRLVG